MNELHIRVCRSTVQKEDYARDLGRVVEDVSRGRSTVRERRIYVVLVHKFWA